MLENQYYNEELNSVVKNYIVPWVTTSSMYKLFASQLSKTQKNINILFNPSNTDQGG